MRKPVIAGNWKMYKTVGESVETALALKPLVANANHCEVVIAPVFTRSRPLPIALKDRTYASQARIARRRMKRARTPVKSRRSCCATLAHGMSSLVIRSGDSFTPRQRSDR